MELSLIGTSQEKIVGTDARVLGFCSSRSFHEAFSGKSGVSFGLSSTRLRNLGIRLTVRAVHTEPAKPSGGLDGSCSASGSRSQSNNGVRFYVGLPMDVVSGKNTVFHPRAIAVGMQALKLMGVEGMELPIWWGVAEKESMGNYNWSGYLSLVKMIQEAGLKVHVSLCFHASKSPKIPLPDWVDNIGDQDPNIFFTDRSGKQYKGCLSLAVDELPVLNGKTPVQVYKDFCESFKSSFSSFIGSTITGISMGLGPGGELRYPSHQGISRKSKISGVGEFQCYDKNMLNLLKKHADSSGNPCWGLGGPHDAPSYNETPNSGNFFFKDHGGSWESLYGDFFLSWYSSELASHGDRLLSLASSTFDDSDVEIYGKVPLLSSWYKTRAHPSELSGGFYNTEKRNGYDAIAEVFAQNSCKMVLPGMDLSDENRPPQEWPESLLWQIRAACERYGVGVSGQNSNDVVSEEGFEQIKQSLGGLDIFIYQRMGAYFFSPDHVSMFTAFVQSMDRGDQMHPDDLPNAEESVVATSGISMQAASCRVRGLLWVEMYM